MKIIKLKKPITFINGTIGATCGKIKLIYCSDAWIDSETGELYTAIINIKNGKIKGFVPMLDGYKRFVYVNRKNNIIK